MADVVAFLASEESGYITGASLEVTGMGPVWGRERAKKWSQIPSQVRGVGSHPVGRAGAPEARDRSGQSPAHLSLYSCICPNVPAPPRRSFHVAASREDPGPCMHPHCCGRPPADEDAKFPGYKRGGGVWLRNAEYGRQGCL